MEVLESKLLEMLQNYQLFKSAESLVVFETNKQLTNLHKQKRTLKLSKYANYNRKVTYKSRPKSTYYLASRSNYMSQEKPCLEYIPFNDSAGKVIEKQRIQGYFGTTPFNALEKPETTIEGDQLAEYLTLNLLKIYPTPKRWTPILRSLSLHLNKTHLTLQKLFNSVQSKFLNSKPQVNPSEFFDHFCNICKLYCCLEHSNKLQSTYGKDFLELITYKSTVMQEIDCTFWKQKWWAQEKHVSVSGNWLLTYKCCSCAFEEPFVYTKVQKFIVKFFLKKGVSNPCSVALFLNTSCSKSRYLVENLKSSYQALSCPVPLTKITWTDQFYYSEKLLKNIVGEFCSCSKKCSAESKCPCIVGNLHKEEQVITRGYCEKYCRCTASCKQRFLGCNCQFGKCDTSACICNRNFRECDPDSCLSCCCVQSAINGYSRNLKSSVLCQNTKIQLRKFKRTGLRNSTVQGAGYGLFVLEPCKANEVIIEYTGELIFDTETLRRAGIYDYKQHSYIFGLTEDLNWSIDSTFMGSKMRYVNHKSHKEENTFASTQRVNGNTRIVLVASKPIKPGSELFFNYGYTVEKVDFKWFREYEEKFART